ncbi:MAG TPA: response regulator transcription factor [Solirubrobacteraceae bacterium]|nr:response regulator transcription factor [Solirubrobacteraceae bacterium]
MPRILLVDDDRNLLELLERGFRFEGFRVATARDGERCLEALEREAPDVVLLDIGLPRIDGFDVLKRVRRSSDVAIVMLSARDEVTDKVSALGIGADDYVAKPFAFDELLARVRAVLRRRRPDSTDLLTFADICCDVATREVIRRDRPVELTAKEFDILVHFMRHPRQVLTRDSFLEHVWGHEVILETNVVDVHVGHLRRKLGEPRLIHTVRAVGFALRADPPDPRRGNHE